jgi:hypothetical protein
MANKDESKSEELNEWLEHIATYEQEFKKWETRGQKILKRYKDEGRGTNSRARFNILWSNVQTLTAATFAKLPKPEVSRRHKDNDPIGRVASIILERALEYEIQKYSDYSASLKSSISDRFLPGRGVSWVRYEPHFRAAQQQLPTDGDQISEDFDEPQEELDYECAPCDYVHWKDFGHTVGRTWEEVTAVWRIVYLTRGQCIDRFGEELGSKIPLDSIPNESKEKQYSSTNRKSRAKIYEIWNKEEKEAIWISKSVNDILDVKPDPLGLDEFFPCPKPLFATLTNDSLEPVPDFVLYQDQAESLDILADRIDGLIKGMKIFGIYDPSAGDLQRMFTEAENNTLIPAQNWSRFSEQGGLNGAMQIVDLMPLVAALRESYTSAEQIKNQIYEITGIADIIRGQTDPNETLGAQQLKGQYASLRLKSYQDEVARFATELLRIKAQIICTKFDPKTIAVIGAIDQLSPEDQQLIPQAMALLIGPERLTDPNAESSANPIRDFRIDITADTLVYLDEQKEKTSRMEFIQAIGQFIGQFMQTPPQIAPQIAPLAMELLKFGTTAFKVGNGIEGKIDQWSDNIVKALSQPAPQDTSKQDQLNADMQKHQSEMQMRQLEQKTTAQTEAARNQMEAARENQKTQNEAALEERKMQHAAQLKVLELDRTEAFNKWKAQLDADTKIQVAMMARKPEEDKATHESTLNNLMDMHGKTMEAIQHVMLALKRPKTIVRGADGKIAGIS